MNKALSYILIIFVVCYGVVGCEEYDDSGKLVYGFSENSILLSPDYMVCLVFTGDSYTSYIFGDECVSLEDIDSSFVDRNNLFILDNQDEFPPEIVYNIVRVDSNLVYCRPRSQYQNNEFILRYHNIRTDVGNLGEATDDRDYLSGYYLYSLSMVYSEYERKKAAESAEDLVGDSIKWNNLYEGVLSSYFQSRLDRRQLPCNDHLTFGEKLRVLCEVLSHTISYTLYKAKLSSQVLSFDEAMRYCSHVEITSPLLYLPFPLGSSAYIFDRRNIEKFEEDSFYCGKKNFYATYYELPSSPESLCSIISYDCNGVLAEMLPETNEQSYLLTLIPESGTVARAHLSNSESYSSRLRNRRLSSQSADWDKARAADTISYVMEEYSPRIFANAFPLVESYAKTMER